MPEPSPSRLPSRSESIALSLLVVVCGVLLLYRGYGPQFSTRPSIASSIDVNTADRVELLQIPGVGPATADSILAFRQTNGPLQSLTELDRVPGIGEKTLDKLRPHLSVTAPGIVRAQAPEPPLERLERKATPVVSSPSKVTAGETIAVNSASLAELQRLPGIGVKLAERIVEERTKAPFTSVEDLNRVSGIGPKTIEKLRPFVTIS